MSYKDLSQSDLILWLFSIRSISVKIKILDNLIFALLSQESRSSSIFRTNDDLSCSEVRPESSEARGLLWPAVVYLNQPDLYHNGGKGSAP